MRHPLPTAVLLSLSLGLFACQTAGVAAMAPVSAAPPALDGADVVWTTPSDNAKGSMPLGNGEVVANAWVEAKTGDLMLLVGRTDALSETCRFMKLGRVRIHFEGNPLATAKDFRQKVKLRQGVVEVSGNGLLLTVFVDSNAHVLHVAGTSGSPLAATATVECWRDAEKDINDKSSWTTHDAPFKRSESADVFVAVPDAVQWYHRNEQSVVPKLLETQSLTGEKGAFDPLLHRTFGGQLSGAGFVSGGERAIKTSAPQTRFDLRLSTHTAQTATVGEWQQGLAKEAQKSADAAAALARTQAWWAQFWGRSWVIASEPKGLPASNHALSVGVDAGGGSRFPGEIAPQPVLGRAATAAEVAAAFAAGHAEGSPKVEPAMPTGDAGFTLSAWVKPSAGGSGRIFDKITPGGADGFLLDMQGGALRLIVGNRTLQSSTALKAGQWQHAAATFDAKTGDLALYLDGQPVASQTGEGGSAVTRGYLLQRYAQGFQGRGAYPIKFNGGFFFADDANPDWRQWGDCYWWQNTRHMYHPMLACGDFDLMAPLFKMYGDAVPLAQSRTAKYHGSQGSYFPETMTLFGTYGGDYVWNRKGREPKDVGCPWWQYAWNQGPELVALMLDKWDYTHDEAFLKKDALPMAETVLRYFDTRFKKDAAGKIVINPAQSVETYWHGVTNDAPTVAGISNITRRLCALKGAGMTPAQTAFFEKMRAACPAIPLETVGGVRKLSVAEKYNPARSNCENPETYAIWPYREVSLSRPQLLEEGKAAYAKRGAHLPSGWGYDGNDAALLGLTGEAERILRSHCANSNGGYRWPATWGPNYDWLPDQNHGGNLLETANLMLLQGESGGKILLLPAWPQTWDVDFKLHAPDQTTVECQVAGGKIVKLKVVPESRKKDVVLPAWAM